jgi:hypothetical protein
MGFTVRRIDYFYVMVTDSPAVGYEVLSGLAEQGVNLVATSLRSSLRARAHAAHGVPR